MPVRISCYDALLQAQPTPCSRPNHHSARVLPTYRRPFRSRRQVESGGWAGRDRLAGTREILSEEGHRDRPRRPRSPHRTTLTTSAATLVEAYRKAVRGTYEFLHGSAALRNPTAEEWAEFAAGCNLRDTGTHLCSLPTGDHCSRGWSASAAPTRSRRTAPPRSSGECSSATAARSPKANAPVSPHAAERRHVDRLTQGSSPSSRTSEPQSASSNACGLPGWEAPWPPRRAPSSTTTTSCWSSSRQRFAV